MPKRRIGRVAGTIKRLDHDFVPLRRELSGFAPLICLLIAETRIWIADDGMSRRRASESADHIVDRREESFHEYLLYT